MKNEWAVECDFWTKRLDEYFKQFDVDTQKERTTFEEDDFVTIAAELKKNYGEDSVKYEKEAWQYKRSSCLDLRITLFIQKNNFRKIYVKISNRGVNSPSQRNCLFSITNSNHFRCYSNRTQEIIALFNKVYEDYEKNMEELNGLLLEVKKERKIHEMAKSSILTFVPNLMSQTNYEWNLIEEDERFILQIKMKRGKMMEITLGNKTFTEKLPDMMRVISQIEQLLATIPYPVNIKSYGRNIRWRKGDLQKI